MYVFVCTCVCVSKLLPNHCSAISPHFRGGNSPLFMLSLSFLCKAFHSAPKLTKLKTRPKSCNWKHDVCDSLSQFVFWFCFLQCFTSNSHIINITKVNNTDNLISELCSAGKYFLLVFLQMFLRHVSPTETLLQTEWNRFLLCAMKAWCLMTNTDIINFTETNISENHDEIWKHSCQNLCTSPMAASSTEPSTLQRNGPDGVHPTLKLTDPSLIWWIKVRSSEAHCVNSRTQRIKCQRPNTAWHPPRVLFPSSMVHSWTVFGSVRMWGS